MAGHDLSSVRCYGRVTKFNPIGKKYIKETTDILHRQMFGDKGGNYIYYIKQMFGTREVITYITLTTSGTPHAFPQVKKQARI